MLNPGACAAMTAFLPAGLRSWRESSRDKGLTTDPRPRRGQDGETSRNTFEGAKIENCGRSQVDFETRSVSGHSRLIATNDATRDTELESSRLRFVYRLCEPYCHADWKVKDHPDFLISAQCGRDWGSGFEFLCGEKPERVRASPAEGRDSWIGQPDGAFRRSVNEPSAPGLRVLTRDMSELKKPTRERSQWTIS